PVSSIFWPKSRTAANQVDGFITCTNLPSGPWTGGAGLCTCASSTGRAFGRSGTVTIGGAATITGGGWSCGWIGPGTTTTGAVAGGLTAGGGIATITGTGARTTGCTGCAPSSEAIRCGSTVGSMRGAGFATRTGVGATTGSAILIVD